MNKNVERKESKRVFKCLERDKFSRRDMQQIVTPGGGGESSNCPSRAMTSKKIVLSGLLAFFVGVAVCFSALFSFGVLPKISYAESIGFWTDEGNYTTSFAEGDGTKENPYKISTAGELARLAYLANDTTITEADYITTEGTTNYYFDNTYFVQTADIDLAGHYWEPIAITRPGNSTRYFSGNYDGGNFKISNLTLDTGPGLFSKIKGLSNISTIQNITLENFLANGQSEVGCISFGVDNAFIYNCNVSASVTDVVCFSGIVYQADNSYIYNCAFSGEYSNSIMGESVFAGITLSLAGGQVKNCVNYCDVSIQGRTSGFGGIVGSASFGLIENCVNFGNLTATSQSMGVGGVIGLCDRGKISNCVNIGDVTGGVMVAGIGGYVAISNSGESCEIINCYNLGKIEGGPILGGLVGALGVHGESSSIPNSATLINSFNIGNVVFNESLVMEGTGFDYFIDCCGALVGTISDLKYEDELLAMCSGELINCYYGGNCAQIGGVAGQDTENAVYLNSIATDAQTQAWYEDSKWNADYPWDFENQWQFVEGENNGYPLPRTDSKIYFDYWDDNEEYYSSSFVGAGTQDTPYLISSAADLAGMAKLVNSGDEHFASAYYLQTSNINLSDHFWRPIGDVVIDSSLMGFTSTNVFSGVYDGDGYTISGLRYNNSFQGANFALFNAVESSSDSTAVLKNITISGEINCSKETNIAGLVIGAKNAEILNCVNECNITSSGLVTGLVYISSSSKLDNLINKGNLSGSMAVGCVAMAIDFNLSAGENLVFENMINYGALIGDSIAGICYNIASNEGVLANNLVNFGNFRTKSSSGPSQSLVAGLILLFLSNYTSGDEITSSSTGNVTLKNSYNMGDFTGSGMLVALTLGFIDTRFVPAIFTVENCFNCGDIVASGTYGVSYGLFGTLMGEEVNFYNCYNANVIDIGFAMRIDATALNVENCYAIQSSKAKSLQKGLGFFWTLNVDEINFKYCSYYGDVYDLGVLSIGGTSFVNTANGDVTMNGCVFMGNSHTSMTNAGALIGSVSGTANLSNCKFIGSNFGGTYSGGLIGVCNSAVINNCIVLGNISGSNSVGGFIGQSKSDLSISHSMFEGNLYLNSTSSSTYVGGFVGNATNCTGFSVSNSLVNANVSIGSTGAYASGVAGHISLSTTSEIIGIDKTAVLSNISYSSSGTLTNSKPFFYSSNIVDTDAITNTYAVYNSVLTISSVTDGMDGAFGYLDNFQGGLPLPLGFYYLTSYANTSGIVEQLQILSFN